MMMQHSKYLLGVALIAAVACSGGSTAGHVDSAAGDAAPATDTGVAVTPGAAPTTAFSQFGDRTGRVPVLEYHVVGD